MASLPLSFPLSLFFPLFLSLSCCLPFRDLPSLFVSDHRVYVWNHRRETPVIVLQGHNRTVNCVTWNPVHQTMLASASDDGKINKAAHVYH